MNADRETCWLCERKVGRMALLHGDGTGNPICADRYACFRAVIEARDEARAERDYFHTVSEAQMDVRDQVLSDSNHLRQRLGELADEWEKRADNPNVGTSQRDAFRQAACELRSTLSQEGTS